MRHRLIAAAVPVLVLVAACGPRSSATVHPSASYRIFLQEGFPQQITVINSTTGAVERQLPVGTPAPDWSRLYVVTQGSSTATLKAVDPRSGRGIAQLQIPRGFDLPNVNYGLTGGLSPNGNWLALTRQGRDSHGSVTTSLLVGEASLSLAFKQIDLSGNFSFDALSNDGSSLYLVELVKAPNYRVRLYNLADNSLWPGAVVDKREPTEPMNGTRGSSVPAPDGDHVYTVYLRNTGPFIHALGLSQPFAFCVDLPFKGPSNPEQQFDWSLAVSTDGLHLYAVNGSLHTVAAFTTGDPPTVVRTGSLSLNQKGLSWPVLNAEAKGPRVDGAALSRDGRTLFAIGEEGVLAIDTQSLQTRSSFLHPFIVDSIRMSSDGAWLYVAHTGESKLWQVNPVTGAVAQEVPGVRNPWAVLWAEPEK